MNSTQHSSQRDMFAPPTDGRPLVLEIKKIQAPRTLAQKKAAKKGFQPEPNFHIPSYKNSKHWITKLPNGRPLRRPILITSPEFQEWMEKVSLSLESQCISACATGSGGIQVVRSKLFSMLSRLPEDDSVNDLQEIRVIVERVAPGEEGAKIVIERL